MHDYKYNKEKYINYFMCERAIENFSNIHVREIELTSPRITNFSSNDENINKIFELTKIIYLYHIIFHIFLFSIFESIFFWFYIVYQEENAFKNNYKEITMLSNLVCINTEFDLTPLYEYMKNENIKYNNDVPLRFTFVLNGSLFMFILFINLILLWNNQNIKKINFIILKKDSIVLIGLFLYEYLFFQNIIYNYKPKAAMDIQSLLFTQCIN